MSKKLWNGNRVMGPEQRGGISVGRAVCYTTDIWTQLYNTVRAGYSSPEDKLPERKIRHLRQKGKRAILLLEDSILYRKRTKRDA